MKYIRKVTYVMVTVTMILALLGPWSFELRSKAKEYKGEGWKMIGVVRQFLEDKDIDIKKKMTEWRKKK